MSNLVLPPEVLDHVVDYLDTIRALRNCCLVSKSWIPRTRKHLFAEIKFDVEQKLRSWKRTFPDPSTSPACYAKALSIDCPQAVVAADAEAGGWIRGFSCVICFYVGGHSATATEESTVSLVPFHRFSPVIKSLHVDFSVLSSSWVFNLILSFPLLEDLKVSAYNTSTDDGGGPNGLPTIVRTPSPPVFTGSLHLFLSQGGMSLMTRWLLSLPGGIHFREFTSTWFHDEDPSLTMALVEKCSRTIETLDITSHLLTSTAIDLSKATRLKNLVFRLKSMGVEWITTAFKSTVPELPELRRISIHIPYNLAAFDVKRTRFGHYGHWLDLDRLLAQFWESRSARPKVICTALMGEERDMRDFIGCLLPELTRRGMLDLAELGTGNGLRIHKQGGRYQPVSAYFGPYISVEE